MIILKHKETTLTTNVKKRLNAFGINNNDLITIENMKEENEVSGERVPLNEAPGGNNNNNNSNTQGAVGGGATKKPDINVQEGISKQNSNVGSHKGGASAA